MEIIANVGLVMLLLTGALVTGAPVGNTTFTGSAGVCESAQLEQEEISCILRSDRGKRAEYYDTVLIKHGFPGTSVRSFRPKVFRSASTRCFSQRQCPESEITWCFNLYHPTKNIELCWDSRNNIINCTANAQQLGLTNYISVVKECQYSRGDSCIFLKDTPFFISRGLLTCTAESTTCVHKSFISIAVEYVGLTADPPKIEFHNSSSELVLGEQNVYLISTKYPTEPIDFFFGLREGLHAYKDSLPISPIPQNGPYCEVTKGCQAASSEYDSARNERVRFYSYSTTVYNCPATSRTYYTWLVIDDARESDASAEYKFSANSFVYNPFPYLIPVLSDFILDLKPVRLMEGSGSLDTPLSV